MNKEPKFQRGDRVQIMKKVANGSDVSGSIKELNHYCRIRDCIFHNGISKRENVMCSHKNPDVVSDKDGMKRCFSYCH